MLKSLGGHFDLDSKEIRIKELESILSDQNIWNDVDYANKISTELSRLKTEISKDNYLTKSINDNLELLTILDNDETMYEQLLNDYNELESIYNEYELSSLLNNEYDDKNCYLEIHPGAGGTESNDWANMLYRMYTMFCDKNNFKYEVIDYLPGEEAGIKSVLIKINGAYAYGYLKSEIGVHRLVRISPFNAAGKRQTSFAAVNVTPEFDDINEVEINDDDIRIDVYRSSGNGGQGVNTTDSAVRITHIPTGIVVTCQNERSQIKNKETALKVLKNKLYRLNIEKQDNMINSLKGNANIDFGSQIRNYVLEPYSLIKDIRSNYESNNPTKVLDGDLMPFINAYLRIRRK